MEHDSLSTKATDIATSAQALADKTATLAVEISNINFEVAGGAPFFVQGLTVFILACFVGYYVVWRVTPALHSPLMGITNAISSVIIVGALIAAGPVDMTFSKIMGFLAVVLASVNIFGGFLVTRRMLAMFVQKKKTNA